ncbi:hypothetical protein, partial [Gilliamella sp. BG1]|uniref:hypothetical protein n=1 Tax=Gilliamella sp. BG1 TaxID=3351508 RepID=UPI003986A4A7
MSKLYKLGLDVGSTTAKCVLLDEHGNFVYTNYVRHNTHIIATVLRLLDEIVQKLGNNIILSVKVILAKKVDKSCLYDINKNHRRQISWSKNLVSNSNNN